MKPWHKPSIEAAFNEVHAQFQRDLRRARLINEALQFLACCAIGLLAGLIAYHGWWADFSR